MADNPQGETQVKQEVKTVETPKQLLPQLLFAAIPGFVVEVGPATERAYRPEPGDPK